MSTDELQNAAIAELKSTTAENTKDIGELKTTVAVISNNIATQTQTLTEIKAETSAFGATMRGELTAMREAEADDRKALREIEAEDRAADRDAKSKWWTSMFKLAGAVVTAGSLAVGGMYAAGVGQAAPDKAPTTQEAAP